MPRKHAPTAFARDDHFPLGTVLGRTDAVPEPPTACRPFGLRWAVPPRTTASIDASRIDYDEDRQIGLIRDRRSGDVVALARHTDGQTGTVTNSDGHQGRDSDTDHRED